MVPKAAIKVQAAFRGHVDRARTRQVVAHRATIRAQLIQVLLRTLSRSTLPYCLVGAVRIGNVTVRVLRDQATYRAHVIRARVRRDMGEALQLVRRRRRPRTMLEAVLRAMRLASETPQTLALALSLSMLPSVSSISEAS